MKTSVLIVFTIRITHRNIGSEVLVCITFILVWLEGKYERHRVSGSISCLLQLIKGTGPDGRITGKDVEDYVPSVAPPPTTSAPSITVASPPAGAIYTDLPLSNIRQVNVWFCSTLNLNIVLMLCGSVFYG